MKYKIHIGDAETVLKSMPDKSVNCCITSPPYWGLRDYGVSGQLGLEKTPEKYVKNIVSVFSEVKRVLKDDGTLWVNLGDSYNANGRSGHGTINRYKQSTNRATAAGQDLNRPTALKLKEKDLVGVPWRVAFALQSDGWYLRQDIIWHKPNPMPESVKDRCTKAHEYIFLLSKSAKYYYDCDAIKEPSSKNSHNQISKDKIREIREARESGHNTSYGKGGTPKSINSDGMIKQNNSFTNAVCLPVEKRNKRSVWTVPTQPLKQAHFATFPEKLIEPCVLAGCPKDGTILDPFCGAGTTGVVALKNFRKFVGIEINEEYTKTIAEPRLDEINVQIPFGWEAK